MLRSRLPLNSLPLDLVLSLFSCYITPIFRYGLPLWLSSNSNTTKQSINAVLTKFIKSYLGVPYHASNSIMRYLSKTQPLMRTLESMAPSCSHNFIFPKELDGYSISFLKATEPTSAYNIIPDIPTIFWGSRMFHALLRNFQLRKKLCREIFDVDHNLLCSRPEFHGSDRSRCICLGCGVNMGYYHQYVCPNFCTTI